MTRFERPGKHAVNVGDLATVSANPDSPSGERGWSNAKVISFRENPDGHVTAVVTKPHMAGVRFVAADRLTRQAGVR